MILIKLVCSQISVRGIVHCSKSSFFPDYKEKKRIMCLSYTSPHRVKEYGRGLEHPATVKKVMNRFVSC